MLRYILLVEVHNKKNGSLLLWRGCGVTSAQALPSLSLYPPGLGTLLAPGSWQVQIFGKT